MSNKPTKSQRIEELKRILKSNGKLRKEHIDLRVANALGCSADKLARALYRDLDELVRTNTVKEVVYTRDMRIIDEYDPTIHRNVIKEWCVPLSEGKIIGHNLLEAHSGIIYCAPFLKRDIYISAGSLEKDNNFSSIYFSIGTSFLSLHINSDLFPVKVIFSRSNGDILDSEIEDLKKEFGIRIVVIKLPISSISAFVTNIRFGHSCLDFLSVDNVEVHDLQSSNGTFVSKISDLLATELIERHDVDNNYTLPEPWSSSFSSINLSSKVNESIVVTPPFITQISNSFGILIK